MPSKKKPSHESNDQFIPPASLSSPRELVVMMKSEIEVQLTPTGMLSFAVGEDAPPISTVLSEAGARLRPLFGAPTEEPSSFRFSPPEGQSGEQDEQIQSGIDRQLEAEMSLFFYVEAPEEQLDQLAGDLLKQPEVETAYVKPPAEPAVAPPPAVPEREAESDVLIRERVLPVLTPDFTTRQGYLEPAPQGVDARHAWSLAGGRGAGVRVIDLEWGWQFSHEDLVQNQGGVIAGTASPDDNHGTAVIGEIGGDANTFGITGIIPDAIVSAVAFSMPTAAAIRMAADNLRPGDIMLLEIHRAGPRFNFQPRADQQGYVAIEWWPDDYLAIRYATNRGIIVVEAAGNGRQNLDDPIYNTNPSAPFGPFPAWWSNPYRRSPLDSGAIVVGAGAPPPGTHGRDHGPDRSRLGFSNYGALVDAQGWGREVTTTGYGDLFRDPNNINDRRRWYTDVFSGTSSASPIVTAALACVQGVLRARSRIPLSPARARELLRSTGSPQTDAPGNPPAEPPRPSTQRIGNRPNLRQLILAALQNRNWIGVQFTGEVPANQTRRWFTHSWPAHWHVVWTVVPTSPATGAPQIEWKVQVERASDAHITYWISITNLTGAPVNIEARYAVLGW
jgi:hypothetical protein